jgi:hypothetical protein
MATQPGLPWFADLASCILAWFKKNEEEKDAVIAALRIKKEEQASGITADARSVPV